MQTEKGQREEIIKKQSCSRSEEDKREKQAEKKEGGEK